MRSRVEGNPHQPPPTAHTPFPLSLNFGDLKATNSKNQYDIRNVSSILYHLGFVLEFSKDFGKSRKPWWGRRLLGDRSLLMEKGR
jgi:hypothetical protein